MNRLGFDAVSGCLRTPPLYVLCCRCFWLVVVVAVVWCRPLLVAVVVVGCCWLLLVVIGCFGCRGRCPCRDLCLACGGALAMVIVTAVVDYLGVGAAGAVVDGLAYVDALAVFDAMAMVDTLAVRWCG